MITAASLATMTAFAESGLTATAWTRTHRTQVQQDIIAPMQAVMTAVERIWGKDFQRELSRQHTPKGVRLHRDRIYLGACTRTPAWLHAATAAWVPRDFIHDPKIAPRIELRLAYGFWEMGFAFTAAGKPWMRQMAANLMPNRQVLERLLNPLLGGHHFDWCVRERQRIVAPQGYGIVNTYEPCEACHFFDGVTAWDRLISAATATAWDTLPEVDLAKLAAQILRMVQRVYPLIILTTAADPDTALRGIENYLIQLAAEHPAMLPKRPSNIIAFPAARS